MLFDIPVSSLALPARMDIDSERLGDLEIAVLKFPFIDAFKTFEERLCKIVYDGKRKELEPYQKPPYRLLNNAILATTSSVAHGFERFQMVSVGEPVLASDNYTVIDHKFSYPGVGRLTELIRCWVDYWGEREWLQPHLLSEGKKAWQNLLSALDYPASEWERIPVASLLNNINDTRNGIGYRAIPSLFVALLHKRLSVIKNTPVEWRKAVGGQAGADGLYLVSRPFLASYIPPSRYDKKGISDDQEHPDVGKLKKGYFSYRLDFLVQTQAGRFNSNGHLKPWLFLRLGCQRYGSDSLKRNNYGRNISFMLGLNEERLDDFKVDSSLVRLEASRNKEGWHWVDGLTDVLEKFKANYLKKPQEILDKPLTFGNFEKNTGWQKDEYYLVHAEGYTYGQHNAKHSIKTGYQFKERQEVLAEVISQLGGILQPDRPFEADVPLPNTKKIPGAMKNPKTIYTKPSLSPTEKKRLTTPDAEAAARTEKIKRARSKRQAVLAAALQRVLGQEEMQILVVYQELVELEILMEELRCLFLLNAGEDFPPSIEVVEVAVDDQELCEPLDRGSFRKEDSRKNEFKAQLKVARLQKLKAWTDFLDSKTSKTDKNRFALIALPRIDNKRDDESQNIKGVVREACVIRGISSQFLRGVTKSSDKKTGELIFSHAMRGKVRNAVQDLVLRQTGALYGPSAEVYELAGLPQRLASEFDMVAFFRRESHNYGIKYPVAVRLRAGGEVDILYPETNGNITQKWQPYHRCGPKLGQLFHQVRPQSHKDKRLTLINEKAFARFVCQVLTNRLDRPTLAVVMAEKWRDGKDFSRDNTCWPQLQNPNLLQCKDELWLPHVNNLNRPYSRKDAELSNLVGIVRMRTGNETPQYIASTNSWEDKDYQGQDFKQLSGFIDRSVPGLLQYFSLGRLPETQEFQKERKFLNVYKWDDEGAGTSFKHQQLIELVPFFLQPEYQSEEMQIALCRCVHYLRVSPGWTAGNTTLPYPMHLGQQLLEDQLCILE